ncbi:MAG TPA: M15 family metallopeptidase [Pyrinomonadaceae bacterium]|nr:M15 family metallopeptidase [Pyrinomonadaceae bacterium]
MLLSEYLPTNCSTAGLFGLSKQIADTLMASLPAGKVTDITPHVVIAGATTLPYLQSAAANALIAAINEKGTPPRLVHALRVLPQQYAVFYWFTHGKKCGVVLAAAPSASPHERAIAIDIQNHSEWIPVLKKHNWIWRGAADPPHFNFHGGSDPDLGREGIRAFQKLWNQHNPTDPLSEDGNYGPKTQKKLEASPIEGF